MSTETPYPPLEEGDAIYFVHVHTGETVHLQAYGFTRCFHVFAVARNAEEAESITAAHYRAKGIKVDKTKAADAIQQDPNRYVFPEQFIRRKADARV